MKLAAKKKFQMPDLNKFTPEEQPEEQPQPETITAAAPETLPEEQPQPETITPEEVQLSDGQTESIPQPETIQFSDVQPNGLPPMMMTNNERYYTQEEFQDVFKNFFEFLENPQTAGDVFGTIEQKGRNLAAGRVYDMAKKYRWLNWLIDKQTAVLHDVALISIWAAVETNTIVLNWTGISLFQKVQIWLKSKIKTKAEQAAKEGKRSVWGFLGRRAAEKQQKQES